MLHNRSSLANPFLVLALLIAALATGAQPVTAELPVTNSTATAPLVVARAQTTQVLQSSSVLFIQNVGQWDSGAQFQVSGAAEGTFWLAADAIWLTIDKPEEPDDVGSQSDLDRADQQPIDRPHQGVNVKISFVGANPHPGLQPFDPLNTVASYFLGDDPAGWQPAVPVWGSVRYVGLYPGVNLEVSSEGSRWAWRLVCDGEECVSALRDVRLRVEGADALTLDDGHLRIATAVGATILPLLAVEGAIPDGQPVAAGPEPGTFEVAFPFSRHSGHLSASLQDNPTDLLYSTYLGGSSDDFGYSIAIDGSGAAYITGRTESAGFPTTPGAFDTTYNGYYSDAFVVKVAPGGGALAYATFLGGTLVDQGNGITVDENGAAFVTGYTDGSGFPTTPDAFDTTHNGNTDAFVVKVAPDGSALAYGTFLGGGHWDRGHGIALDGSGAAYVYGWTYSSDFPTTPGAFDSTHNGGYDTFVSKVAPDGSALTYSTYLGGSSMDNGNAIAVDGSGAAFVAGSTESSGFPTTPGAFDTTHNGGLDVFVSKVAPDGSALAYSTFLGGSSDDQATDIALDEDGAAYVTGPTDSSDFPTTPGAFDTTHNGGRDALVVKVAPDGSTLVYSAFLGANNASNHGRRVAVDDSGAAYLTGSTNSPGFPTTPDAFDTTHNGDYDAFVVKVSPDGSVLVYSSFLGGGSDDYGICIAIDDSGVAYITGSTGSSGFPTTSGAFDTTHNGNRDAFVAKLAVGSAPTPPTFYLYLPLVVR
jgi:hypothetical protein